jgi:outer membrane protein
MEITASCDQPVSHGMDLQDTFSPSMDRMRTLLSQRRGTLMLALAVLLIGNSGAAQQPSEAPSLSLSQAVSIALEKNPQRKAAMAETRAAAAGVRQSRSLLFPNLTFSETATRGNDPVYVFGSRLRQQRFTADDFALNRLNTPLPFGNFSTRLGASWNLFDSMASWRRVTQAKAMEEAAGHQLERADQEIVFQVVSAYYKVLLEKQRLAVAEQSIRAAQSILDNSKARYESGLTVESDLLNAQVRMSSRQQELIQARNNLALAQAQLNLTMGVPAEEPFNVTDALAERSLPSSSIAELEQKAITTRPDLKRIQSEESAQKLSVAIAKSSFGPRVNAFASWEMDNPTFVAGGGGNNWIGGLELQFDLFRGGARRAELSREKALADKVEAMKQAARDGVKLEVRRSYYDTDAARQQVEVARAAVTQAQESLRISQNRYQSGLATITDLLSVEDATHRTQFDYWEAVYRELTSYASLELSTGTLNADSPVVKP